MKPKLILDTDIGSDVDDAYALLLALNSPEYELATVTLVHARLDIRAKIALKMMKLAGRLDVPVASGYSGTLTPGGKEYWGGHEGAETDFSDIAGLTASPDAIERIVSIVGGNPGNTVIASVGPMTNVAAAIQQAPDTMKKVRRIVVMASVFRGLGRQRAGGEHNANVDTEATRIVLESGLLITLVGLNVTMQTILTAERIKSVYGTPVGDYVARMGEHYLRVCGIRATWMHDPLAVAIAVRPEIAVTKSVRATILESGEVEFAKPSDGEPALDVCVDVDMPAFEELFFSRIAGAGQG